MEMQSRHSTDKIRRKRLSFAEITMEARMIGEDCLIALYGGAKPHIGCTVLAVPRPSLAGSGEISVTSSVINVTGHKDEEICRYAAEQTARKKNAVTVCTGGFHMDGITKDQIGEVILAVRELVEEI